MTFLMYRFRLVTAPGTGEVAVPPAINGNFALSPSSWLSSLCY